MIKNKKKKFFFRIFSFLLLLFLIYSCLFLQYKDYKRIQPNVFFKLHHFGEDLQSINEGDLITVNISYSTLDDSIFFKAKRKLKLIDPGIKNSIYSCFIKLHKGDSASFIFRTSDFFVKNMNMALPSFLKDHKRIRINVSLLDIQTEAEYQAEKEQFITWTKEINKAEQDLINGFLEEKRISVNPTPSGLYFLLLKEGDGRKPVKGDIVKIHYEGRFIDGRFLDSSKEYGDPMEFVFGQELIVIKGMEEAIGMMREGDKALIIVPSDLAFGSSGAGEGIVPPFSSLIYELELIKVKKYVN